MDLFKSGPSNGDVVLSIVIPVLNEAENIEPLLEKIRANVEGIVSTYEIIFVDDGSQDTTWKQISKFSKNDSRIKGLSLSRNFGHQHALLSGYSMAQGQAIISMDGDLQHPAEMIPEMVQEWNNGFKIINTQRLSHQKTSLFKKMTSKYFYRFFSFISNVPLKEGASDFRLIDSQALENVLKFNDVDFFFRGIVNWIGFPTKTLPYKEALRVSDKSKYSLSKMIRFAMSGIVAFTSLPLKIGIWIGLFTSLLAFVEIIYMLVRYFQGVTVPGWASTVGIVSFLFGILFMLLGCIGLYIANIHESLKNRPRFIIQEKINL